MTCPESRTRGRRVAGLECYRLDRFPGVDEGKTAARKISGVARGETGTGGKCRGGNLGVKSLDGTTFAAAERDNVGVTDSGSLVERQHAALEIIGEHRFGGGRER